MKVSYNQFRKCSKCGKTQAEDMSVTFHRFPVPGTQNISKARAWAKFCWPDKDLTSVKFLQSLNTSNKVLCGRHFDSLQFYDSERKKLSKFAIPASISIEELLSDNENLTDQIIQKPGVDKGAKEKCNYNNLSEIQTIKVVHAPISDSNSTDELLSDNESLSDQIVQEPCVDKEPKQKYNYNNLSKIQTIKVLHAPIPASISTDEFLSDDEILSDQIVQTPGFDKEPKQKHNYNNLSKIQTIKVLHAPIPASNSTDELLSDDEILSDQIVQTPGFDKEPKQKYNYNNLSKIQTIKVLHAPIPASNSTDELLSDDEILSNQIVQTPGFDKKPKEKYNYINLSGIQKIKVLHAPPIPASNLVDELLSDDENLSDQTVQKLGVFIKEPKQKNNNNILSEIQTIKIVPAPELSAQKSPAVVMEISRTNSKKETLVNIESSTTPSTSNCKEPKTSSRSSILSQIDVRRVSELNPREVKLYNICRRKTREIRRLRNRLKDYKKRLKESYLMEY